MPVANEKPRILQDSRDMIMTLFVIGVAMILTIGFTGLCSFNPGTPENGPVREVDSKTFLQMEANRVSYPVLPPAVPDTWTANSNRAGSINGEQSTVLGFVTEVGAFLQITQTAVPADKLPADGKARTENGVANVDGNEWKKYEPVDQNNRTVWVGTVGHTSVMLEGTAPESEFEILARAAQKATPINPADLAKTAGDSSAPQQSK